MRNVVLYVWLSLCLAGIVAVLMPAEWLPDALTPFTSAQGTFAGKPVQLAVPQSKQPTVRAEIMLKMEEGVCAVSSVGSDGEKGLFKAGMCPQPW